MPTTNRAVRVPDETWHAAVAKAAQEGTTVTAIVNKALERYNARPAKRAAAKRPAKRAAKGSK